VARLADLDEPGYAALLAISTLIALLTEVWAKLYIAYAPDLDDGIFPPAVMILFTGLGISYIEDMSKSQMQRWGIEASVGWAAAAAAAAWQIARFKRSAVCRACRCLPLMVDRRGVLAFWPASGFAATVYVYTKVPGAYDPNEATSELNLWITAICACTAPALVVLALAILVLIGLWRSVGVCRGSTKLVCCASEDESMLDTGACDPGYFPKIFFSAGLACGPPVFLVYVLFEVVHVSKTDTIDGTMEDCILAAFVISYIFGFSICFGVAAAVMQVKESIKTGLGNTLSGSSNV